MKKKFIDTHVHLLLSKKQLDPDWHSIGDIVDIASTDGLDGICVAEHIESAAYEKLMTGLFIENALGGTLQNGFLILRNGLCLYPAAEIQLDNGSNIGVHADINTLLSLSNIAGAYSLAGLSDELNRANKSYVMIAHHIFWPGKLYPDLVELSQHVHAIEVPAKDIEKVSQYIKLATDLRLPTTGGSDSHTFMQTGACYTSFSCQSEWLGHESLIQSIRTGECSHMVHNHSRRLVRMSNLYRKNLVAI